MISCTAGHEAAHAVLGELLGHPVQEVTVQTEGYRLSGHLVHGGAAGEVVPGLATELADLDSYPLFLAGGWAGEILSGQDPATADEHCAGDDEVLRQLGHGADIVRYRKRALAVLRDHEAEWRRVAEMLAITGTATGEQVRQAMAGPAVVSL